MKKLFLVGALLVGLSACSQFSGDLNPPQQAYALNKEYQAVGRVALGCLKVPACEAKAGDAIRSADSIAFTYVENTTAQAKDWQAAPEEDKATEAGVFATIFASAKAAVASLSSLLK